MLTKARELVPDLTIASAKKDIKKLLDDDPLKAEAANKGIPFKTLLKDRPFGTYSSTNTVLDEIRNYCRTFDISVSIVNDDIRLSRDGGAVDPARGIHAQLGKNLLSPPRRRMDNMEGAVGSTGSSISWEMKMLLSPEIGINSIVYSDQIKNSKGTLDEEKLPIKVTGISHSGTYYGKNWYTDIIGTAQQAVIKTAPIQSVAEAFNNPKKEPKL
jgi:hypothetical protein